MDPLFALSRAELLVTAVTSLICVAVVGFTCYLVGWQLRYLLCAVNDLDLIFAVLADVAFGATILGFVYAYVRLYCRFRYTQRVVLETKGLWMRFDSLMHSRDGIY